MKPTFSAIVDPQETPVPSTHDYSLLINRQPRNKTLDFSRSSPTLVLKIRNFRDRLASPACVDNTYRNLVKEHKSLLGNFSITTLSQRFVNLINSRLNELRGEQAPTRGGRVLPENLVCGPLSKPLTYL